MRFSLALLALPALAAAAPVPGGGKGAGQACNSGPVQCCNETTTVANAQKQGLLGGLLGVVVGPITGLVGLNCSPISVVGVLTGNSCTAQTVCCDHVTQNGLVNVGCTPISL
uniref:Class I hydrophobin SC4 n=1 Tax=Schizophyllum commune TaxID=5334 RepID=SC4_SCHCO|nr:RecName: Full=Fruiting body protein SC4; AltName: Full=Hydrophobin SC4; Flags: Precursor [Schizophyllum commune]AAA33927.1 Sc4 protein [Schizophyllum commune]